MTLGPPVRCWGQFGGNPGLHTDATGYYIIDLAALSASPGASWDIHFVRNGVDIKAVLGIVVSGPTKIDVQVP